MIPNGNTNGSVMFIQALPVVKSPPDFPKRNSAIVIQSARQTTTILNPLSRKISKIVAMKKQEISIQVHLVNKVWPR
jgi:phosphosulfolactate phosphohydrolase-like enzyme